MSAPTYTSIDPSLSRSWLLVSAARPDSFSQAAASAADQIVLDIEDAVDDSCKDSARTAVVNWLQTHEAWVRINDATSPHWEEDVRELRDLSRLRGVVLAKVESIDHVNATARLLGENTPIVALLESALGIEEAPAIARTGATCRLAFGSGDYRRDTGAAATDLAMSYPRSRLMIASRIADLPGPIDGPTTSTDHTVLRQHTELASSLGMTGRLCLFPDQTQIVNETIGPTGDEIDWAQTFLADFQTQGGTVRDGSDKPRLDQAHRIMRLATAFGSSRRP